VECANENATRMSIAPPTAAPRRVPNVQIMSKPSPQRDAVPTHDADCGTGPDRARRRGWEEQLKAASAIARVANRRVRNERLLELLTTLFGLVATCMAAGTAITVVTDGISPSVTAGCALGSAVASSLITRLHPARLARHLRMESVRWVEVFDEANHLERLLRSDSGSLSFDQVEQELRTLEKHRNDALRRAVVGESLLFGDTDDGRDQGYAPDATTSAAAPRISATNGNGTTTAGG